MSGSKTKEDVMQVIIASMKRSPIEMKIRQLRLISQLIVRDLTNVKANKVASNSFEEKVIKDGVTKIRKVPCLVQLGVPLNTILLQVIVQEISLLAKMFPGESIMRYDN